MKNLTFLLAFLFYAEIAFGQLTQRDSSFGSNGFIKTDFADSDDICYSVALQKDGKIITAGISFIGTMYDLALQRLLPNGAPDTSFGSDSKILILLNLDFNSTTHIAIRPNDRIIVGGYSPDYSYHLLQFNEDGSLDSSFGKNGISTIAIDSGIVGRSFRLQPDGKIVVGGYFLISNGSFAFAVARFNSNGTIDKAFGSGGRTITYIGGYTNYANDLVLEPDGRIIIAGSQNDYYIHLIRYDSTGIIDSSFGKSGISLADSLNPGNVKAMILQPDGKIVVAGSYTFGGSLAARYLANGTLDSTFGQYGFAGIPDAEFSNFNSVAIDSLGKIILGGYGPADYDNQYFELVKLYPNGTPDLNFAYPFGGIYDDFGYHYQGIQSVIIQTDNKILAAGFTNNGRNLDFVVARYPNDFSTNNIDILKPSDSIFIYPNPVHSIETLQYSLTHDENLSINLYDINGRLVQSFFSNQKRTQVDHKEELNFTPSLPAGNYVLVISNGRNRVSIKVVKE